MKKLRQCHNNYLEVIIVNYYLLKILMELIIVKNNLEINKKEYIQGIMN